MFQPDRVIIRFIKICEGRLGVYGYSHRYMDWNLIFTTTLKFC